MRGVLLLATALILAACQFVPENIGPIGSIGSVPQPFRPEAKTIRALTFDAAPEDVYLAPITGLDPSRSAPLRAEIAKAAVEVDVLAYLLPPERPTRVLEGLAKEAGGGRTEIMFVLSEAGGSETRRTRLNLSARDLETRDGRRSIAREIASFLGAEDSQAMEARQAALANDLAQVPPLPGGADHARAPTLAGGKTKPEPDRVTPAAKPAPAPVRISLALGRITGAKGDGNEALRAALIYVFEGSPVVIGAADADLTLTGTVAHAPTGDGNETLRLTWTLSGESGTLGTIAQENVIPAASLDGAWDEAAFEIALGAAEGLFALITEIDAKTQH